MARACFIKNKQPKCAIHGKFSGWTVDIAGSRYCYPNPCQSIKWSPHILIQVNFVVNTTETDIQYRAHPNHVCKIKQNLFIAADLPHNAKWGFFLHRMEITAQHHLSISHTKLPRPSSSSSSFRASAISLLASTTSLPFQCSNNILQGQGVLRIKGKRLRSTFGPIYSSSSKAQSPPPPRKWLMEPVGLPNSISFILYFPSCYMLYEYFSWNLGYTIIRVFFFHNNLTVASEL